MSETSIHVACGRGDLSTVKALIKADPTCVNADDQYQWRPIFHAALNRKEEIVRELIHNGADVAAHDGYAMHYAGEVPDNKIIVRLLIQHGALHAHVKPVNDVQAQFLVAVFIDDVRRVRALLKLDPSLARGVDGRGDEPIHHAARNGDLKVIESLVDAGADVNARGSGGNTVLYCAGGHGHVEVVEYLLDQGADRDARFGKKEQTLNEWLAQYPDDLRFQKITALLA